MLRLRNVQAWRIFVNLYFRNFRSLHFLFQDRATVEEILTAVKKSSDIEDSDELVAKMKEIDEYQFEKARPLFVIKRPFDD